VDVLLVVANISAQITASINVIGYVISCSVTSLSITHQPSSSGLLGSLLHLTLNVVVGLNVNILSSLLQPLAEDLDSLGILDIFVNIGISISISL